MKSINVALLALAGMLLTSVSVYSLTPPGGITLSSRDEPEAPRRPEESRPIEAQVDVPAQAELSRFTAGSTLTVDGRMAHAKLLQGAPGETFVMLEVRGADTGSAKSAAPVNLALVIDRSGSMKGSRMRNAQNAATTAVDRLHDGDVVSVITFDTQTAVVVPPTSIGSGARERVIADIRSITLGGDTCVSCGVEEGLSQLDRTSGRVNRMIVLSDGDANHGVRDVPGFRSIAERARSRGVSVTTIGVDVDYNEKILSALAQESNGRHYFVENDDGLARIFEAEAESLTSSIASGAEASIDLAPGVELDRVLDRSFRRSGSRVIVPLGTFDRGEVKTVLLKVRVPTRGPDGALPVAGVELAYKDLLSEKDGSCTGKLGLELTGDVAAVSEMDPVVAGRVSRSETGAALREANGLFQQGRVEDARRKLDAQAAGLRVQATKVKKSAKPGAGGAVDKDFERQLEALDQATSGFATPPPSQVQGAAPAPPPQDSRQGKGQVRKNQQNVFDMSL